MPIITWKEVYETGIAALDNEHRKLVEQINRLGEVIRDKRNEEVVGEILAVLLDYTENHFQHEERLLQEYGFPGLAEHQEIHQALRNRVEEMKDQYADGHADLTKELYKFLRSWLLGHIVDVDKNYGAYLESRAGRFVS